MALDATNRKYAQAGEIQNADETQVFVALEDPLRSGRLPSTPYWREVEANSFSEFGTVITTTARSYFNPDRVEGQPRVTKEEAQAGWQADVTDDQFPRFARGFLFSDDGIVANQPAGSKPDTQSVYRDAPTPIKSIDDTAGTITIVFDGAQNTPAMLGSRAFMVDDIIKILDRDRGPNNNRLARVTVVDTASADHTLTVVPIYSGSSLVAQSQTDLAEKNVPGSTQKLVQGLRVVCVGHRLSSGAAAVTVTGTPAIASLDLDSATTPNFTSIGLSAGETIFIGGDADANRFTDNAADDTMNDANGFATIGSVSDLKLTFSQTTFNPVTGTKTGKAIDIFFGSYLANGSTKRSFQVERTLGNDGQSPRKYQSEVVTGCLPNECTVNFQPDTFVNADLTFMPLIAGEKKFSDTLCHAETNAKLVKRANLGGYAAQIDVYSAKIRRQSAAESDSLFKWVESATVVINNNATGTSALGVRGYIAQNARKLMISGTMEILFQKVDSIEAIRKNETCLFNLITLDEGSRHAMIYDIPSVTLSGGLTVEQGSDIKQNIEVKGFGNSDGHVVSITSMLHVPNLADSL